MSAPDAVAAPGAAGLLRQFSTTVIDQVVLSGANFIVGLLLIRQTSDVDYGMFVLVQSAIALLISGQSAWLSSPLAVLAPTKPAALKRLMMGAVEASQRRFLRWAALAALAVPALGYVLHYWSGLESLVAAFAIGAAWAALQREYLRSALLIYGRPQVMLMADVAAVATLLCAVFVAVYGTRPAVLGAVTALILSALAGQFVARRSLSRDPGFPAGDASPFWREMRPLATWATVGAVTYWLYSQSYNYVLAGRIDLQAVANVNAARLLLMPTIVVTVGVKALLVPTAAGWLVESNIGRLVRRLLVFATAIALADLAYCGLLWMFRDVLTHDLMHKTILNRDELLVLWALVSLIGLYRDVLQTAVFALRQFRALAVITALSAIVSLSIMAVGIVRWGAAAVLIGQVAGEIINLAAVVALLVRAHRREDAQALA
jgi:O-antigen/teichoic acid export membrane protein